MSHTLINGDNIDVLKKYPDNYFDAVVTDPPYGLGKEPDATELMKSWVETGYHEVKGSGFMGKEWDAFVPQPIFWKEVFRVLKPGGHVLAFYGTRTYDWGVMAMRFAGFEVRDTIYWHYGSGFPKSHNIIKAIDKMYCAEREVIGTRGLNSYKTKEDGNSRNKGLREDFDKINQLTAPSTPEAKQWDGWGSALKPASEPIVMARKPLEKGLSIAENVLKYGTGAINIDGCRISYNLNIDKLKQKSSLRDNTNSTGWGASKGICNRINDWTSNKDGRFPANLILTCTCDDENNHNEDCPVKIIDEQSDLGGASRFFYCAKASKAERNKGLEGFEEKARGGKNKMMGDPGKFKTGSGNDRTIEFKNFHPTVKPVKLMQYLVRLVTPPNAIVLDPFCGSGTTGIACKLEGFEFVGIEQDAEYIKIAEARIANYPIEIKQTLLF